MKYVYFVVEGQHDSACIGRILTDIHGFKLIKKLDELSDDYWEKLIPEEFPYKNNLLKRVPVPYFYKSQEVSIAVQIAEGDRGLVKTLCGDIRDIDDAENLSAIGLFCDADEVSAATKFKSYYDKIRDELKEEMILNKFLTLSKPGQVSNGSPKTGIYVFPDNFNKGNLENVLLDCASVSYSDLLDSATSYVKLARQDYKSGWKVSSENKAIVGCIANILRPGKSNQVSIQDNDWICEQTIDHLECVSRLNQFIKELIS